jgi:predicted nucleic acid-binding Zn ribbon protein
VKGDRDLRPLGGALERVVGGLGARSVMLDLHREWSTIVGEAVADHCRPQRLENGRLVVEVDHPGWATELRFLEARIIERVSEILPDMVVTTMSVTVTRRSPG